MDDTIKQVKRLQDYLIKLAGDDWDDYHTGFYNGFEVALSILEHHRAPVFKSCCKSSTGDIHE